MCVLGGGGLLFYSDKRKYLLQVTHSGVREPLTLTCASGSVGEAGGSASLIASPAVARPAESPTQTPQELPLAGPSCPASDSPCHSQAAAGCGKPRLFKTREQKFHGTTPTSHPAPTGLCFVGAGSGTVLSRQEAGRGRIPMGSPRPPLTPHTITVPGGRHPETWGTTLPFRGRERRHGKVKGPAAEIQKEGSSTPALSRPRSGPSCARTAWHGGGVSSDTSSLHRVSVSC